MKVDYMEEQKNFAYIFYAYIFDNIFW